VHLAIALHAEIPEPLVVEFLVLGRGDEALGGLGVIDAAAAGVRRALGLGLALVRRERARGSLGMVEAPTVLAALGLVVDGPSQVKSP
jgi:hypothetical protein